MVAAGEKLLGRLGIEKTSLDCKSLVFAQEDLASKLGIDLSSSLGRFNLWLILFRQHYMGTSIGTGSLPRVDYYLAFERERSDGTRIIAHKAFYLYTA